MVHIFSQIDSLNNTTLFNYLFVALILFLILSKLKLDTSSVILIAYGLSFFIFS